MSEEFPDVEFEGRGQCPNAIEIYNVSNESQNLGKVAAEAAIRWPGS